MKYIEKPNLPQGKVTLAAINREAGESIKKLNSLGIKTLKISSNPNLPIPVNSHADLQLLHIGFEQIFSLEHLFVGENEKKFKCKTIKQKAGNKYPEDVRLNCTIIDNILICNEKTVAPEILEFAYVSGFRIVNVNQGYSRCSICIINENAIITDDKSIYAAAGNFLNDVVFISKGSIGLNGYNYGFIGGCCGKIDKDTIAFNGRIESHTDYKIIIDALNRNNVGFVELTDKPLYDIGGIIPLCE